MEKKINKGIFLFVLGIGLLIATSQGWLLPRCDWWNLVCSGQSFVLQNGLYVISIILTIIGAVKMIRD